MLRGINAMKLLLENWKKYIIEQDVGQPEQAVANQVDQIIKLPYQQFVTKLSSVASDPKVQAVLQHGLKDGEPNDEKVQITEMAIPVTKLKPTQNEIDINGSLKWAIASVDSLMNLLSDDVKVLGKPIVTANNGTLVIDGHHRWSQAYCINPEAKMKAINLNIQGASAGAYLKVTQMAIAVDIKKVPTQTVQGINLLDSSLSKETILNYVLNKAPKQVLIECANKNSELYKAIQAKIGGSVNAKPQSLQEQDADANSIQAGANLLTQLIYNNVLKMRKTSQPVKPASKRDFMPQTDDAKNWTQIASSGMVNFKDPKNISGVKQVTPTIPKK